MTSRITRLATVAAMAMALTPGATAATTPGVIVPEPVPVRENDPGDKGLGSAVDVDGDTMVAGAVCDPVFGGNCDGSAYVFVRSGDGWVQQRKFIPPDRERYAEFGNAVAVSGDTIVIGAYRMKPGGKAYVYVRSGSKWSLQAKLTLRDQGRRDGFGSDVAIDGDTIVVGAPNDDVGDLMNAGSATVFTRTGSTWTEQTLLRAADRESDDNFGASVALQGDVALVGATDADTDLEDNTGAVYGFARSGGTWTQNAKLFAPPDGSAGGELGASVALDGDSAVAGDNYGAPDAAHVFVRSGDSWSLQATLVAGPGLGSFFGQAVDISGDTVVVGDRYDAHEVRSGGAAYVYARTGDRWSRGVRLKPEVQNEYDQFGVDVAADGGLVAIGAYTNPCAVWVYER